jgi:ribosomal-protein-alanine N-acetyltransferase
MKSIEQSSIIYQTDRLYVRGLCRADIDSDYFLWFDDQDVCRHNSHGMFPNSRAKMEAYFDEIESSDRALVWAIIVRNDEKHVGNISLQSINWKTRAAEFAILLGHNEGRGKGYGYEVAMMLLSHGFTKLGLNRIYCGTSANNIAMQKLAGKLGMLPEGRRRSALYEDGKYVDVIEYGLLKEDYETD